MSILRSKISSETTDVYVVAGIAGICLALGVGLPGPYRIPLLLAAVINLISARRMRRTRF